MIVYTENDAKQLLQSFFAEMNAWGLRVIQRFDPADAHADAVMEELKAELGQIYSQYLTQRTRKTGRLECTSFSLGSPDYDPALETIESVKRVKGGFEITTKRLYPDDDDYFESYQYKIKTVGEKILLDSKALYSESKGKWVRDIL